MKETSISVYDWKEKTGETAGFGTGGDIEIFMDHIIIDDREREKSNEKINPEKLYETPGTFNKENIPKILRIRDIIINIQEILESAKDAKDEIDQESHMLVATEMVFQLFNFIDVNRNFKNAFCLIHTAVEENVKDVYTVEKIDALCKALDLLKNNIFMDVEILDKCSEVLENAGFKHNAPLNGINLYE